MYLLEYWPWGKINRLFPFDYKPRTLGFWVRSFTHVPVDLKSFAADTKKAQTTSRYKIFIFLYNWKFQIRLKLFLGFFYGRNETL